jgi:hypothetical protein
VGVQKLLQIFFPDDMLCLVKTQSLEFLQVQRYSIRSDFSSSYDDLFVTEISDGITLTASRRDPNPFATKIPRC